MQSSPPFYHLATYDKAKADALKIHTTGNNIVYRVNTSFAALAAMRQEGGSPGAARAADKLETGRRVKRVRLLKTDANLFDIK